MLAPLIWTILIALSLVPEAPLPTVQFHATRRFYSPPSESELDKALGMNKPEFQKLFLDANFTETYFPPSESEKLDKALGIINCAVNKPEFQKLFLDANFTETEGLTNREILKTLLRGDWGTGHFDPIFVEFFNDKTDVMGFVQSDMPNTVFLNRFYMRNAEVMAEVILHETMHLVGYNHYDEKRMGTTVPYMSGQILRLTSCF